MIRKTIEVKETVNIIEDCEDCPWCRWEHSHTGGTDGRPGWWCVCDPMKPMKIADITKSVLKECPMRVGRVVFEVVA